MSLGLLLYCCKLLLPVSIFYHCLVKPEVQVSYELALVNFLKYNNNIIIIHRATMLGLRWVSIADPLGSNLFLSPTLLCLKNLTWWPNVSPRSVFSAHPLKHASTAGHCLLEIVNNRLTEFVVD